MTTKLTPGQVDKRYARLQVIDRLEIGPVEVEKKRLKMPYRLFMNGREHLNVLIYRYNEPVFDPQDAADRNLAAMIGVQVALNYGLFCKKMVFADAFDGADRDFIVGMMENTSREIYVNKLLQENPFLQGVAKNIPCQPRSRYTNAEIVFSNDYQGACRPMAAESAEKFAVLSSGGKDSLLSFGLLNELGFETHSIFGNESGRHWYTAINAWRYFEKEYPQSTRVWMNADRVFNWMLRRLPFIVRDYQRIRADIYPLRLWTVAVFLFGALPLMRRRGIANLIIGDEYDTTVKANFRGIEHYDGLYDQSRYFDAALSEYYDRKGWGTRQFSLLRPLSELLILKILCKRYPQIQAHQVSCHAAHVKDGKVYPCGRCEKCRRIITMLLALGNNPQNCGFLENQFQPALDYLQNRGLHQEEQAQQHLLKMLQQTGYLPKSEKYEAYPEVLSMRFHPENARPDDIPQFLRQKLFSLISSEAEKILAFTDGQWQEITARELGSNLF